MPKIFRTERSDDHALLELLCKHYKNRLEEEQKKPHMEYQERRVYNDTIKTYCSLIQTLALFDEH